jgi:hypothetical protein
MVKIAPSLPLCSSILIRLIGMLISFEEESQFDPETDQQMLIYLVNLP